MTDVDNCDYLGDGRLSIRRGDAIALLAVHDRDLAEVCLLDELDLTGDPDEMLLIENPWWDGMGSGSRIETLTKHILTETTGFAQLLLVWEGGNEFTGLEVNQGTVTEKPVRITLE